MKKILLAVMALLPVLLMAAAEPTYTAVGKVCATEGWGETVVPVVDDVKVEAYDDYVIIRSIVGVEGYDMQVGFGADDAITYLIPITDGVEGEKYTKGYSDVPTGLESPATMSVYLGKGYCYGGFSGEEAGYVLLGCYWGQEWSYYYCVWPPIEEGEWENPFEGEATLLYTTVGHTEANFTDDEETSDDEEGWGESIFPLINDIDVEVYDKYIYIKDIAGVDGYGAKVAYNADAEVLSIMPVVDGVDGDPCKTYCYLSTGIEDIVTIQAYNDSSYAYSNEDKSGYVVLSAYLYDAADKYTWSYYYLCWSADDCSVSSISAPAGQAVYFDINGRALKAPEAAGVYIRLADGKATKVLVK